MNRTRNLSHRAWPPTVSMLAAIVLAVGLGALTVPPAQAAAPAQIGWISADEAASYGLPEATIVVDATGTSGYLTIGWDASYNAVSLMFQDDTEQRRARLRLGDRTAARPSRRGSSVRWTRCSLRWGRVTTRSARAGCA